MSSEGTARALLPVTEHVLAWVARTREHGGVDLNDLRAIELCALATREAAFFHDLYGGNPDAAAPQVPDERSAPGRVPPPEGVCGCSCPR